MATPYTIHFGPWSPDLSNVATEASGQSNTIDVPCGDCLNVYYADGCYQSINGPGKPVGATTTASIEIPHTTPSLRPLGAFTATDASGNTIQIAGNQTQLFSRVGSLSAFASISGAVFSARDWQFAQFGQSVYALDGSAAGSSADLMIAYDLDATTTRSAGQIIFTASITSSVLNVTAMTTGYPTNQLQVGTVITAFGVTPGTFIESLGTGTGGTGTYNLSTTPDSGSIAMFANLPPTGNVIATVGQFLFVGNIGLYSLVNPFTLGTGNGSQTSFTGTIPNVPLRGGSVTVIESATVPAWTATDDGTGFFPANAHVAGGTINYATGAIFILFNNPPPNGAAILVNYTQAFPERVAWSAIGLPEFFPAPLTNAALAFQSSFEDLEGDLGPVTAIFGYPLYALIFQRNGITRAIYQGGNVVFAFGTYEWKRGLIAQGAAVQVGPNVYYLSDQGWFYTDGANVYPIGTAPDNSTGIDNWFWENVNYSAISQITAGYDASMRSVVFAIPTGTNTQPDTLLTYNILSQRWTRSQISSSMIWTDSDGTRHYLGVMSQNVFDAFNNTDNFFYQNLTGPTLSGYMESCDLYFIDAQRRLITGARPLINCSDQPLVTIGSRNDIISAPMYAAGAYPDRFSKLVPCLSSGIYNRVRVTSSTGNSFFGATLFFETEGPM